MSNSSLVSYTQISPMKNSPRNHKIDSIAIHTMAGNLSVESCGGCFQTREASANYGIDSNGRVGLYVDEGDRSWCTSNAGVDNRAVTIEVASTTASEPFQCTQQAWNTLINLCADICRRNGISSLKWRADAAYGRAAANGGPVTQQNMFAHRWFAQKSCPGTYLYNNMGRIASEVNEKIKSGGAFTGVSVSQYIFVGDSRTVGMEQSVGSNSDIWSCSVGMGYNWMVKTGVPAIEGKIKSGTAVVILMGINDFLGVEPSTYYNYINQKANSWSGKGAKTYFVSINPVRKSGYNQITNDKIQSYNERIKAGLNTNVGYIDTFSQIINSFNSPDGLHYDANTYKKIYQIIKTNVGSSFSSTGVQQVQLNIDYEKFNPYVMIIDRGSSGINYKTMKKNKFVAAIVEAGYLYSSYNNTSKLYQFENPRVDDQCKNLKKYKIPFGMFFYGRAHTTAMAKSEIYEFSFPLRRLNPQLGVWIQLDLGSNVKLNDQILTEYYNQLVRLGFKSRMGIICSRSMLKKITWKDWQEKFFLCLIDHVKSTSEIEKLMDPEFFDTDGQG